MSVARATFSNHAHARVTSTFQSILLVYMVWRSVGVPSRQEYAEAFRSTYITMVRRARLLENIPPPRLPAEATIDERWTAWIAWESGRRTAWSTLVSETELSVHWNLPEPFAPDELTGKLPCDDSLWEAPSAMNGRRQPRCSPPCTGVLRVTAIACPQSSLKMRTTTSPGLTARLSWTSRKLATSFNEQRNSCHRVIRSRSPSKKESLSLDSHLSAGCVLAQQ